MSEQISKSPKLGMPKIDYDHKGQVPMVRLSDLRTQLTPLQEQSKLHPEFIPLTIEAALKRILGKVSSKDLQDKIDRAKAGQLDNMQIQQIDTRTALEILQERVAHSAVTRSKKI